MDGVPEPARRDSLARDFGELEALGLDVTLVDVRAANAVHQLARYDLVWVRGGNTFVLRKAFADTGADSTLTGLLRGDALVYGGYSAGPCILAPEIGFLQEVDDITVVKKPVTTGLGLLDRPFVPHVASPGHPETDACTAVSAELSRRGQDHWALVLVVEGDRTALLRATPAT